jgi:N-acyl-D-amino-acid deacylase
MQQAIAKIDAARKEGLPITADMYAYTAGATGLDAAMPTWVQQGGIDGWVAQLKKPDVRKKVIAEMRDPNANWESLLARAGSPDRVLLIGFKTDKLKPLTGKTLAEVAKMRGVSPEDAAIDLVIEDHTRVGTAYFLMSEENVKLGLSQPWVNIGSDAEASAPEGPFLLSNPHPRAYGTFRALPRPLRARSEGDDAAGRHSAPDAPAGRELQAERSRLPGQGLLRRHRRVRSGEDQRPRDVRQAAPVRGRSGRRVRERHAGAARRRAHGREARPGRARPRLGGWKKK